MLYIQNNQTIIEVLLVIADLPQVKSLKNTKKKGTGEELWKV